jgi:lysylphosphatidylglycerol synthetase-like protein (DUF2156 family)
MIKGGVSMKKFVNMTSLAFLSLLPSLTLAADYNVEIKDPATTNVSEIIGKVITWVLGLVGGIAVLFIVYAGILYVTSGGNKERIEKAKQTLTYAVIGLIVIVLAGVIVKLATGLPTSFGLTK